MKKEYIPIFVIVVVLLGILLYKFAIPGTIYNGKTCSQLGSSLACATCKDIGTVLYPVAICCEAGYTITKDALGNYKCVKDCVPSCACSSTTCKGLTCSDGCGGICQGTKTCTSGGGGDTCIPYTCNDLNRQCGTSSDGCGGTLNCGGCGTNQVCSNYKCVAQCVPSCSGKQCGNNGCDGSCGTCETGKECVNYQCVSSCGNGNCESAIGETCSTCSKDCGLCAWCKSATECCADTSQRYCTGTDVCGSTGFCENYLNNFNISCTGTTCCPNKGDILDSGCVSNSGTDCCCPPTTPFLTEAGCVAKITNESLNYFTQKSNCYEEGETCDGYFSIQCTGNNFIYTKSNSTIIIDKCGVECTPNQIKEGYVCKEYKWVIPTKEVYYRFENNNCTRIDIFPNQSTENDYALLKACEDKIIPIKETYYRLSNNTCNEIELSQKEVTFSDYSILEDCEAKIVKKKFWDEYGNTVILGVLLIVGVGYYFYKKKGKWWKKWILKI